MPSLNISQNLISGQKEFDRQQVQNLRNQLGQMQGIDVTQTPEFQQLTALDPNAANQISNTRLTSLKNQMGLDDARTNAMFKDAQVTRGLLDVSQDRAIRFLDGRTNMLAQMGGNPSDTLEIRNMIASGDVSGAKSLLDSVISAGQQSGILATPEKKAIGQTGLVFDPNTGEFNLNKVAAARIDELVVKKNQKGTLDTKDRQAINKDITGFVKEATMIRNTASDLEKLKSIGSGPASIAAVFKFMKALDPTSVVREGEFALAEKSSGVPEAVRNFYNKLIEGERLAPNQFDAFVKTAKGLANNAIDSSGSVVDGYLNTFEDTLPKSFAGKVRERLPSRFEASGVPVGVSQTATPTQIIKFDSQGNIIGG